MGHFELFRRLICSFVDMINDVEWDLIYSESCVIVQGRFGHQREKSEKNDRLAQNDFELSI